MEVKKQTLCSLLLVILLLASQEAMTGVEGRLCKIKSGGYKGPCASDTNCAQVCISEGFSGGNCEGLRRRCICQKIC